jgi:hypothetical protein
MEEVLYAIPTPPMPSLPNSLHPSKSIAHYSGFFEKRLYSSFKGILQALLLLREGKQADMAFLCKKSPAALQHFFAKAHWCADQLNTWRLRLLRSRTETRDRTTDILVLDGTPLTKDKDCESEGISRIYDNRCKSVVIGYEAFGAAIVTRAGITYPLRVLLHLPSQSQTLWQAWRVFLRWCFAHTKARLIVVDRGFRNPFFLAMILRAKREFLVRASRTMAVWVPVKKKPQKKRRGRRKRFPGREKMNVRTALRGNHSIRVQGGTLRILPNIIVEQWKNVIGRRCSVIVFQRDGFRQPLVLVYSRRDITVEEAAQLLQCYFRRWKIESCFLELKQLFQLEHFKVTSVQAIERHIALCLVAHSILLTLALGLPGLHLLRRFITFALRRLRGIKRITLQSLKLFLELSSSRLYDFTSLFQQFLAQNPQFAP